jgi:hypothetical protein
VTTLSLRALNRATLDRQFLLRRHPVTALQAVRHLAGLQGQAPLAPYVGLWTRLSAFPPGDLSGLVTERAVVRAAAMRGTVHVMDAADFAAFRPLFSPLLSGVFDTNFRRGLAGADPAEVARAAQELLASRTLTRAQIGRELAARWPAADPMALAYGATYLVPVVQVPPRGIWGKSAQATWTTATAWLGTAEQATPEHGTPKTGTPDKGGAAARDPVGQLVLRYLTAFGPASVADIQTWSGLTRLREVTERLPLRRLRGHDGAELLDLPDAPLPGEDAPAPPRFLPEYDNLLLSHADRRRVIPHARQPPLWPGNGAAQGTVLIDGQWNALWKITSEHGTAVLTVTPFRVLAAAEEAAIAGEGAGLLAFTSPGKAHDIRFAPAAV